MYYFLHSTVNAEPDQPIVLTTAPTGSAAFQIGGSTIDSALLIYDSSKTKPSWEKKTIMQLKLEHLILSLTDQISMVGYKKFQSMNQTICAIKGTTGGDWGNICVLAVGDLYQLPPVGQRPIYMAAQTINTLNGFAPNGWEKMQLHELTQTMQQKDKFFAKCLNAIHTTVPEYGFTEDTMLQQCELKVLRDDPTYPRQAMHVYAHNDQCDQWNNFMLQSLSGSITTSTASDTKKDHFAQLANVVMPEKPHQTGNLRKVLQLKVGASIMVTNNIDVSGGLTNGARGTVTNIITDQNQQKIQAILVQFDNQAIGEDAKKKSKYKHQQRCSSYCTK